MRRQKLSHIFKNNTALPLFTKRLLLVIGLLLVIFTPTDALAQDLPDSTSVVIPRASRDTARVAMDSLFTQPVNIAQRDSISGDSLVPDQEVIADVVDYFGKDYVFINRRENKVYLYNEAFVTYQDMKIEAGIIVLDYNKNEVTAKGIVDTAGTYTQMPVFTQGQSEFEPDSIIFNFDTQKALIYNSRTVQNGFRVRGEVAKKVNDSVVYMSNVRFTTSENVDDPEYYFYARKVKFVPKKKIVTGLTNMYIADVPTPIGLPFAFFPLTEDRKSGFILPLIGEDNDRGFFFQNFGYYIPIADYADLTVMGDYFTNGSYGVRVESAYRVRYKFNGNLSFRFENNLTSERGFPDFAQQTIYNLRWNHSQDTKANPNSRFSASVNLGRSQFYRQSVNQNNTANFLNNNLSSSVSYTKVFQGNPQINLALTATHTQNSQTEQISMTLPTFTGNVSRVFPFAPKSGSKKGILQNINLQYDVQAINQYNTTDSLFFRPEMFRDARLGARHTIPITTNFKVLNYLSASVSANYQETWVFKTFEQSFDPELNEGAGGVAIDTIRGFDSYRTYNFSASVGTTIYGNFPMGLKKDSTTRKIQAIRHVLRPTISYSNTPSFDQFYDEYTAQVAGTPDMEEVVQYSRFENTLYGAPSNFASSNIGLSISNTIEAKVRDKDTTATEPKKIMLLNNLSFSTNYNLLADSLNLAPISFRGSLPVLPKLDLNFGGSLDPYALNNNNQRIDMLNINNGGSLFRLTDFNMSMNYAFNSKDFFTGGATDEDRLDNETFRNGGRPDDLFGNSNDFGNNARNRNQNEDKADPTEFQRYRYSFPWDLRLAYTITYSNRQRENTISSHSLMFSGNVELSPRWSVGASSGYDFTNKGFTFTQFRFNRDLESWNMNFTWVPFSNRSSWYFYIGISADVLSDIKYDKQRRPDQRL